MKAGNFTSTFYRVVCRGVELNPYIELLGNEYNNYSNRFDSAGK